MMGLYRNKVPFWYQLYEGEEPVTDEDGYRTGEMVPSYSSPVACEGNISPASGTAQTDLFGMLDRYEKVINPMPKDCPMDEMTLLFVDREPEYDGNDNLVNTPDYIVTQVAESLNCKSYRIKKVDTE